MADAARAIALRHFRAPLSVETKPDRSPVTIVDRSIEQEMRRLIRSHFPQHGIQGEEFGSETGGDFTWVLDPIDGTKSFITGYPLFGSLIALLHHDQPVLGIIEAPAMRERWIGQAGLATTLNGQSAHCSECDALERAHVYTTSIDLFPAADRARFEALTRGVALRRYGGDCYLYGLLAAGHCDLVAETCLKPHDFQALVPVVEGAGGRISDWEGQPLSAHSDGRVVAAATERLWRAALVRLGAN